MSIKLKNKIYNCQAFENVEQFSGGVCFNILMIFYCAFLSFGFWLKSEMNSNVKWIWFYFFCIFFLHLYICACQSVTFNFISPVKPTSINITAKPKKFASEMEYTLNCVVVGSIPETDIRWTQNNRPFTRRKVHVSTIWINF